MMTFKPAVTIYCIIRFHFEVKLLSGFCADSETEDYVDASKTVTNAQADSADDYDQYEINEFESPVSKSYFCAARSASLKNDSATINKGMDYLDDHGIQLIRSTKHHYQVNY